VKPKRKATGEGGGNQLHSPSKAFKGKERRTPFHSLLTEGEKKEREKKNSHLPAKGGKKKKEGKAFVFLV